MRPNIHKCAPVKKKVLNMSWTGEELFRLQEARDLLRLNDEAAAVRYLVTRGLEAMTGQLASARMLRKLETQYSPQEVLPLLAEMEKGGQALAS